MSWRQDSSAGAAIWDTEPMSAEDLLCRDEELIWLAKQDQRRSWQLVNGRIARSGDPTANIGSYGAMQAYPPNAAQTSTAVTTATPGTCIWTIGTYSPILANAVMAPSSYRLAASGTVATSTTSQTINVLPFIGTGSVNAAPTTHQDLGVSGAVAVATTALTAVWYLQGDLTIRSTGTAGTAWFMGHVNVGLAAAPAATTVTFVFGGTVATVDWTGATANYPGGLGIAPFSASTTTWVTNSVSFVSFN